MHNTVIVTLPGGYWLDGVCYREAELRPLTGDDEAFLLELGESLLPAQRTTAVLARCVSRIGSLRDLTPDTVRSLTIGDREALLLHLRRLTLGDRLQCLLSCAAPGCGKKLDLELHISDLLLPPYAFSREHYEVAVTDEDVRYRVRVRVPTGADAEAAASVALADPQGAADGLLRRCVETVMREDGQPLDGLPPAVSTTLPATISELDPQAEVRLNLACPECGQSFSALFDAGTYFFQEIAGGMQQLYREVHFLALHYHWSEAEIMGMTPRKRHRYLTLLSEALTQS